MPESICEQKPVGHITRQGSAAARAMLTIMRSTHTDSTAAWRAMRRLPTVKAYFERIQRDDPLRKKIALVATSHFLARVMWAILKHGTLWKKTDLR